MSQLSYEKELLQLINISSTKHDPNRKGLGATLGQCMTCIILKYNFGLWFQLLLDVKPQEENQIHIGSGCRFELVYKTRVGLPYYQHETKNFKLLVQTYQINRSAILSTQLVTSFMSMHL